MLQAQEITCSPYLCADFLQLLLGHWRVTFVFESQHSLAIVCVSCDTQEGRDSAAVRAFNLCNQCCKVQGFRSDFYKVSPLNRVHSRHSRCVSLARMVCVRAHAIVLFSKLSLFSNIPNTAAVAQSSTCLLAVCAWPLLCPG
jgi:hypothetical protein